MFETGDPASAIGATIMGGLAITLIHARHQLLKGRPRRAVALLVISVLAAVLVSAPIPPPVPALAAAPIMAVAFALSFLDGRPLKAALIAAWVVAIVVAIITEFTPVSPDLPPVIARRCASSPSGRRRAGRHRPVATSPSPARSGDRRTDLERGIARQRGALSDGGRIRTGSHLPRGQRGPMGAPQPGLGRAHRSPGGHLDRPTRPWRSSTPTTVSETPTCRGPSRGSGGKFKHELRLVGRDGTRYLG